MPGCKVARSTSSSLSMLRRRRRTGNSDLLRKHFRRIIQFPPRQELETAAIPATRSVEQLLNNKYLVFIGNETKLEVISIAE